MVLGLRAKTRGNPSIHLDYIITIKDIKPWPPSQSLRTLRAVSIQWEYGDNNSGSTTQAVPSIGTGSGVGDGRIDFNESFRLPVTLSRELSVKGHADAFQKNCIEFNLYELRRDKTAKGQLLGTAVVDLAEYGVVREILTVNAPFNCKRTYRNTVYPLLYVEIQPFERSLSSSSSRDTLMREASMERSQGESVSALMNEEYAEEAEVASLTTDDDVSSHSSSAVASTAGESNGSSSPLNKENGTVAENDSAGDHDHVVAKSEKDQETQSQVESAGNPPRSSSMSDLTWITQKITSQSLQTSVAAEIGKQPTSSENKINEREQETKDNDIATDHKKDNGNASALDTENLLKTERTKSSRNGSTDNGTSKNHQTYVEEMLMEDNPQENEDQARVENGKSVVNDSFSSMERLKNGKSVRSSVDSSRSNGSVATNQFILADAPIKVRSSQISERKDAKVHPKEIKNLLSDNKVQQLENKIKMLEGELREAAGIEVSLYSVVAEHGSSMNKVHAPARRLSRLYFHASNEGSKSRKANAARSIISGLVLVAKACGNDVPRLTFWLSNSIALRVIVERSFEDIQLPTSIGPVVGNAGNGKKTKKSSPLKWESLPGKSTRSAIEESFSDWENPRTFAAALEKVESWIFSRIIESIWWQIFTPYMQSGAANAIRESLDSDSSKIYRRTSSSVDEQQGISSLELWKKAFKDACKSICPVRAEGHDCGCLHLLPRLIMEQLVGRLDVAMFNAILRESADEIPTDPVADPISDAEVLPIPAGKASFGAGAQLKNAIGNWSRWLTDLFGIDDDDDNLLENESTSVNADDDDERLSRDGSSKSFHLLNALSDLLMLPKDMLLSRTIRKEVCPIFGPPLIRRVLNSFAPDEFCPDPIPRVVLEALNSEDPFDPEDHSIMMFPCAATPITYQPPSAVSVAGIFGEIGNRSHLTRSGSLVLKKSQTSDDELDELDSPLRSIIMDNFKASPSSVKPGWISKEKGSAGVVRYQLLREVWKDSEQP